MTEDSRIPIMHLLAQQKYEEALSILDHLVDQDPTDRESRMYHLLVVRIIVLRWNLSRAATEQGSDSLTTSKGIIRRFGSGLRVSDSTKLAQSLGRMYQAAATTLANRGTKRIIAAGAGFVSLITLLAFQMREGSHVAIPVYSKAVPSTIAPDPTVSALEGKADDLNRSGTSDEDGQLTLWSADTGERSFPPVPYETKELLPTEQVKHSTGRNPALSGAASANATPRPKASKAFGERPQGGKSLNVESPKEPAAKANNSNKAPIKILATYQSGRAIPIRNSPRFGARTVQDIDSGISLNVLEFVGSWAKVEIEPAGTTGFVRREFLIPVKENELNVAQNSSSREVKSDVTDLARGSASR